MAKNQQNNGSGGQQQRLAQNEVISAGQKLAGVLEALNERGDELADVLPNDITLAAFLATVNQALRNNPKLLRCTGTSLIDACVKAAYDGLRIDGKEAAIVDANERYQDGGAWKDRAVARYMPMVFGLIKQILQTGAAVAVKSVIVYKNEAATGRFTLLEGTTPGIHHQPFIEGEDRGEMIGAYAIATLASGIHKFEWMDKRAIEDVKEEAKTDKVWKRWPTEMWKKTVVRRLRKTLAGTSQIRDMEAAQMFPQFDRTQPHPQLAGIGHNSAATERPTRAALAYDANSAGVPLDLESGQFDRVTGEVVENVRDDRGEQRQREKAQPIDQRQAEPEVQLPENEAAWGVWGLSVERALREAKTAEAIDAAWADAQPIYKHATKAIRDRLTALVTDRNTALALGDDDDGDVGTE